MDDRNDGREATPCSGAASANILPKLVGNGLAKRLRECLRSANRFVS